MIRLHNLMFLSGLDLNVDSQTWCFLRFSAEMTRAKKLIQME